MIEAPHACQTTSQASLLTSVRRCLRCWALEEVSCPFPKENEACYGWYHQGIGTEKCPMPFAPANQGLWNQPPV